MKCLMYKAEYHPRVKKDLKKIDPQICKKIRATHIPKLLNNPEIGQELTGDLHGTLSYYFIISKQQFRVAYIVDNSKKICFIQMIAKRENFYNLLKKRI